MNGVDGHQESLKRRWGEDGGRQFAVPLPARSPGGGSGGHDPAPRPASASKKLLGFFQLEDEIAAAVVPPVTVVLEGRSICHRVHLRRHSGYEGLALELRRLFVDTDGDGSGGIEGPSGLSLSNAVPGHIVAYEDMEDDLLLAGDLNWKDFVRVAKRIRILPAKASRRRQCGGN